MGCHLSKGAVAVHSRQLNDSIHGIFCKEARRASERGEKPHFCFKSGEVHPLLAMDENVTCEASHSRTSSFREDMTESEVQQLMFHTKNRCDTVDRRDIVMKK